MPKTTTRKSTTDTVMTDAKARIVAASKNLIQAAAAFRAELAAANQVLESHPDFVRVEKARAVRPVDNDRACYSPAWWLHNTVLSTLSFDSHGLGDAEQEAEYLMKLTRPGALERNIDGILRSEAKIERARERDRKLNRELRESLKQLSQTCGKAADRLQGALGGKRPASEVR